MEKGNSNIIKFVSVTLFLLLMPCIVDSVKVVCETKTLSGNTCRMQWVGQTANIVRVRQESPNKVCVEGKDYGYSSYSKAQTFVWAQVGCGGVFDVTAIQEGPTWSRWSPWTACSVTCGSGTQSRDRTCLTGTNSDCSNKANDHTQSRTCTQGRCLTSTWNAWGSWGACSKSCGTGSQSRVRTCSSSNNADCSNDALANLEVRQCNTEACPNPSVTETIIPNNPQCGKTAASFGYRVVGGDVAGNCQFPWMVMLYNTLKGTSCGGSIIDSQHIMTAAHCVVAKTNFGRLLTITPQYLRIFTGSSLMPFRVPPATISGLIERTASSIVSHEDYDDDLIVNDIAIIRLRQPIQFDQCHVPICLPSPQQEQEGLSNCKTMGWGVTDNSVRSKASSRLMHTDVRLSSPRRCTQVYRHNFDANKKLCVEGTGTGSCSGDSGGPLACQSSTGQYYKFGIVSSGARRECGNYPSMYTKVTQFLPWIKRVLESQ